MTGRYPKRTPKTARKRVQVVITKRARRQRPVPTEEASNKLAVLNDVDSQHLDLGVQLDWVVVPQLLLAGVDPLFAALFLALGKPREVTGTKLQEGNKVHWRFSMQAAEGYLEEQLKDFQFNSQVLLVTQQATVAGLVKAVLCAWGMPGATETGVVSWVTSDNYEQRLCWAFQEVVKRYLVDRTAHLVPMVMAGNLVLRGTNHCDFKREENMGVFLDWALSVFYGVGGRLPVEYSLWENLLWDCIFLGVAFLVAIGVN